MAGERGLRSANQFVNGPSPERAATTRMRRLRPFRGGSAPRPGREGRSSSARATKADFVPRRWNYRHSSDVCDVWCLLKIELIDHCLNLRDLRGTRMSDVAEKLARSRLLRSMAMIAVVVPATLFAGCARQEAAPPPPPAVSEAPPPAPAPPPPPPPAPTRAPA